MYFCELNMNILVSIGPSGSACRAKCSYTCRTASYLFEYKNHATFMKIDALFAMNGFYFYELDMNIL